MQCSNGVVLSHPVRPYIIIGRRISAWIKDKNGVIAEIEHQLRQRNK